MSSDIHCAIADGGAICAYTTASAPGFAHFDQTILLDLTRFDASEMGFPLPRFGDVISYPQGKNYPVRRKGFASSYISMCRY